MMEVPLQNVLLNNIDSFFHLPSCVNLDSEPLRKYYEKIEEILKLLKPILEATIDTVVASHDLLEKSFVQLVQSVDKMRDLSENWHPLASRVSLVLQVEPLIAKIRISVLEIFRVLKDDLETLQSGMSATWLEHCIQKVESITCEQTESIISEAVNDEVTGHGLSPERLVKIADLLGLRSNQEIFIEAVALEKLKENSEQAEKNAEVEYFDQLITLIMKLHEHLIMIKQSQSSTPVPIPADFCCPLSLDLMTDPVIVSSGQTYERAYISKWLELGVNVCPKTRQTLGRTNLIPNYTVKALIAGWCEQNNVKLPDPIKSVNLNQPLTLICPPDWGTSKELSVVHYPLGDRPTPPDSPRPIAVDGRRTSLSSRVQHEGDSSSHPHSGTEDSLDIRGVYLENESSEEKILHPSGQDSLSSSREEFHNDLGSHELLPEGHNRTALDSCIISDINRSSGNVTPDSHSLAAESTDGSGQLMKETHAATPANSLLPEHDFSQTLIVRRSRSRTTWHRPSERNVPRIVSSTAMETRTDFSVVENRVKRLVEDLNSASVERQREATAELRLLAKHNMDNRVIIAESGAINLLVKLLYSTDPMTQENAVTALLNLSLSDNNKTAIANADAIEPLIHVLQTGSPEARGNSAATLFSLSVIEENKLKIGRSGAIGPLVDLLGNGTLSAKKDAASALFNLSISHENKAKIVQAGAIKYLIELMDPATGMVDKAVAALANLATIQEGKNAIGQLGGIPVLVEVVELGSARGKENAAAALLQLCTVSSKFCNMALQEGAVPPLVALSQSGTARGKEKAQGLLGYFKRQRHGNPTRG